MTTFYSPNAKELKVGPGRHNSLLAPGEKDRDAAIADSTRLVRFRRGFAEVALDDPERDEKLRWLAKATPTYGLVNLGEDSDQVPEGETGAHTCPECGKSFRSAFAVTGHLRSHAPKG